MNGMGRKAVNIVITEESKRQPLIDELRAEGMKVCIGKVGSMNLEKIIAAVMTAAKREKLWESDSFREEHAIYDATVEALHAVCRGQLVVSEVMRTIGLSFCIIRGNMFAESGEWVAIAMFGTVGAPIKGFEHETVGLGINHI